LCGAKSADISGILGYMHEEEMAHRDNISILAEAGDTADGQPEDATNEK